MRALLLAFALQLGLGSVASAVWAAPVPAAGNTDFELAKAHFKTGEIYYDRGRYPDAAREFEEAYRLSQRGELLYNMGKSYDGAGDQARALKAYRQFLASVPSSADRKTVNERVVALERLVGRVNILASVAGAQVEVDGEKVGTTPLPAALELNPGGHKLLASKEGWKTFRSQVVVAPGTEVTIDAKLDSLIQLRIVQVEVPRKEKVVPVYKRWWLWTIVGVVVVGGAVAGGVLGSRTQDVSGPNLTLPKIQ